MKVLLFGNSFREEARVPLLTLLRLFEEFGVDVLVEESFYGFVTGSLGLSLGEGCVFKVGDVPMADLALSVGGDGTFLSTARCVGRSGVPILGINTGNLGFLADCGADDVEEFFREYMSGRCYLEERALLEVEVDGVCWGAALNEVAVLKRDSSSMIRVCASVDGEFLNVYQGDGLVVATPTGSTAYSMSVGGPIVSPRSGSVVLSAVAPHSLSIRPLVIPDDVVLELEVRSREHRFLLSVDGVSETFDEGAKVVVKRAPYGVKVVKREGRTFYETLRNKLMWGKNPSSF